MSIRQDNLNEKTFVDRGKYIHIHLLIINMYVHIYIYNIFYVETLTYTMNHVTRHPFSTLWSIVLFCNRNGQPRLSQINTIVNLTYRWWFQINISIIFSPIHGEMIQFDDAVFQLGGEKPPPYKGGPS